MKKSSYHLLLSFCLLLIFHFHLIRPQPFLEEPEEIRICEDLKTAKASNHHGKSLILGSDEPDDLYLHEGDTFGDPNGTYAKVEDCYLAIYYNNKVIWSLKGSEDWRVLLKGRSHEDISCFFRLERDGNLYSRKEFWISDSLWGCQMVDDYWNSQTDLLPAKTKLRLHDKQVQIVQTFKDGTHRFFFADENHQEFIEDLGAPKKVADNFIVKSHGDKDKTILRRNEYIGDLNGTHLILQTTCDLQLLNKNKIIWTYIPQFRYEANCTLNVAEDNIIEISKDWTKKIEDYWEQESIIYSEPGLKVAESKIALGDSEPIIIQTLKNGSELIFYGGRLKKEPTQIAKKTITSEDKRFPFMGKMNYIGNLTGLHLILEQNCSLILANGNRRLWEFKREPPNDKTAVIECFVELDHLGDISLIGEMMRYTNSRPEIFDPTGDHHPYFTLDRYDSWSQKIFKSGQRLARFELTLINDSIMIKTTPEDQDHPDIFQFGPNTHGVFLRFIAERPTILDPYFLHWSQYAHILPKMGYIGDLDEVHAVLNENCNLVLYNKTQVLWESGNPAARTHPCRLELDYEQIQISVGNDHPRTLWSGLDSKFSKELWDVELSILNGELWLTCTFSGGAVHKYQAIRGTNHFELVLKPYDPSFMLDCKL